MKKLLEAMCENKLLNRLREYTGFQKLLFIFIPFFCFMALFGFFIISGYPFPNWARGLVSTVTVWLLLTSWVYLMIGAQVHWKARTRNIAVNLASIILAVVLIVFAFV